MLRAQLGGELLEVAFSQGRVTGLRGELAVRVKLGELTLPGGGDPVEEPLVALYPVVVAALFGLPVLLSTSALFGAPTLSLGLEVEWEDLLLLAGRVLLGLGLRGTGRAFAVDGRVDGVA